MAKEKRTRQKAYLMMFGSFACVLAAGLLLILAFLLLYIGKEDEASDLADVQDSEESRIEDILSEDMDEDPQADLESEEEGMDVELLKVKEVAGETGDITLGIDVSRFQETTDWEQVAASGVGFVMVRIGYRKSVAGEIVEDECARYNLQEAAANGVRLGAYFFSTAVNQEEAEEEAAYTGMFYAAKSELQDGLFWDTEVLEQRYRIWVAQYLSDVYPELPNPEYDGRYAMWQYTDHGTVPGNRTVVDLNVAYFGYEETVSAQEEGTARHAEADPEVTFEEVNENHKSPAE